MNNFGMVFEITGSGFVPPLIFAGTPGNADCRGKSVSALAQKYGGLSAAAAALGYPSVRALQEVILAYCEVRPIPGDFRTRSPLWGVWATGKSY